MATGGDTAVAKWSTHSGKYANTASGDRDVLLISSCFPQTLPTEVVLRRDREELTEKERVKLEHQGIGREHHTDDLSILKARYTVSTECSVADVVAGEISCNVVKKRIASTVNNSTKPGVVLHYIGPGKRGTGDWCFQDGYVTFKDIIQIFLGSKRSEGQALDLVSDCSYSGHWVRQAMDWMDEQGVGPCGHAAKEKGVLLQVIASCQRNEVPTKFSFSVHFLINDKNTTLLSINTAKVWNPKVYDNQHPSTINFTEVVCGKDITSKCSMSPNESTWKRWSTHERIWSTNKSIDAEGYLRMWLYILFVDDDKVICDLIDQNIPNDFEAYGQVLMSEIGPPDCVPEELVKRKEKQYAIDYNYSPTNN